MKYLAYMNIMCKTVEIGKRGCPNIHPGIKNLTKKNPVD